ncbi:MAG: hypothetical protein AB7J32_09705 [Pseudonocardia sp.]
MFELIADAPRTGGSSPTIWAWPQITEYLKIAGQPVAGPWPPHQEPRPEPDDETGPVAVAESRVEGAKPRAPIAGEPQAQPPGEPQQPDEPPAAPQAQPWTEQPAEHRDRDWSKPWPTRP